jgi:hypothetical protein
MSGNKRTFFFACRETPGWGGMNVLIGRVASVHTVDITFHDSLALLLAESLIHDRTHDVIHRNKNKQIVQTQKGLGNTITANQSQSTFEDNFYYKFYLCVFLQR